jgi:hypothetical protein
VCAGWSRLYNFSTKVERLKDYCCRESAQSHEFKYPEVFEGLPQRVCADFFCDLKLSKKKSEGLMPLKCSKGGVEVIS